MRDELKEALDLLLKRFLISLPFLAIGVWLFIPYSITSFFALVPFTIVGALLAGPLSSIFSEPMGSFFNPRSKRREVHLAFSLPESRIMDGRYDRALDLYREMLEKDPQRLEVYLRILDLAFRHMERPEIARETFSKGIKTLKEQNDREMLSEEYRRLRTAFRDRD